MQRWNIILSNRTATHPSVILLKKFLEPLEITQKGLASHLNIPVQCINEIVRGKRSITPDTAQLFSEAFNTSLEFWLNLQSTYDRSAHKPDHHVQPLVEEDV